MSIIPFNDVYPRIHESVFLAENVTIIGDVEIGEESSIWFGTVIRGDVFHIRLGKRVNIQDNSVVHVTDGRCATIVHDNVTVGHRAILHGCTIEEGCLIGMGAIVMDRSVVGARSLVAAGALVTEGTIIPPESLVVGSPAKVKRSLNEKELQRLQMSAIGYAGLGQVYKSDQTRKST